MSKIFTKPDKKQAKDITILADFVFIFCRENHRQAEKEPFTIKDVTIQGMAGKNGIILCDDCRKLLTHGIIKRLQCTQDPKPMCKNCKVHCYAPEYRAKIRRVMRFSGMYLLKHGRLDMIFHYFF